MIWRPGLRVKLPGRLVGDQQLRAACQRPRDRDALLLAARELVRPLHGALSQPHDAEHGPDPLFPAARVCSGDAQRYPDVLCRGQDRNEAEGLEDERYGLAAERNPVALAHRRDVKTSDQDRSAAGLVKSADDIKQCVLPCRRYRRSW
jgi:hypothetical protein